MSAANDPKVVGKRMVAIRNWFGESQDIFAKRFNIARENVSAWENGRALPSDPVMLTLFETYGISADFILFGHIAALPASKADEIKPHLDRALATLAPKE